MWDLAVPGVPNTNVKTHKHGHNSTDSERNSIGQERRAHVSVLKLVLFSGNGSKNIGKDSLTKTNKQILPPSSEGDVHMEYICHHSVTKCYFPCVCLAAKCRTLQLRDICVYMCSTEGCSSRSVRECSPRERRNRAPYRWQSRGNIYLYCCGWGCCCRLYVCFYSIS